MKRNIFKPIALLLSIVMVVSLFSACGGQSAPSARAESGEPSAEPVAGEPSAKPEYKGLRIGSEYASEPDPMGAFMENLEEQLHAACDTIGLSWGRADVTRQGAIYGGVLVDEQVDAGYLYLYKSAADGGDLLLVAGGSWALESDRIDEVFVQFIDEEAKAASDQLMAAVYSDAVASGLGKAYEGCRQAEEIHHGIQSSDTATLSIQERTSYTNMQFFGLRREGDILYFLEGDEAVVWGFSLKEDTYKLPDEIIPEELGGCPVTRVDLTARSTDLMYGREDIVQGTYIAIPATAEVVGIRQSMSVTYLIPEHVKTLYVPAIAILQNSGTTILAAGRDMRVVINNRKGILASGPSIQAYYGTDLARLAENMRWNLTYLDTFDGRWEDTEKMVSERLDQYEAEDPEAYNDLVEGIGRDGLMDQVKENWEDIVLDASDPGKESLVAYQHFKVGDYTPIMDQDALTAEAEAYEGELGPELPASDTRGEEEPANEEQENEEWSGAVESHSTAEPHFTEEPLVTEEPQVPDEPYTPEEPQVTDEPYTAEEPSAAGNTVVASGGCGDAGSSLAWSLSGDGVLTISGSGRMKDYSHPQYAPQSSFAEWQKWDSAPWLYYDICTGADGQPLCRIQQVEFGEGITYIGEYAFTYSHIPSVTLPEGLTEVGVGAFGSSELTSVTLPSTLRTIGSNAFTGCKIASLTIPEGVTAVGGNAFGNSGCSATTGARNMIIFRQIMDVTILSRDCAIEDTGKENNAEDYAGWDDIYTVGDPSYTITSGYPGSTAEAFAQKWGYTFRSLDDASEQAGTGKKLLAVETYNDSGELSGKKSYEYNDAGLPVRCVEQSYGDWSTKLVYTYTYDGEGRLLNKHMSRDDGEYETDVFVRSYNDDGTLALSSYTGIQDIWTTEEYTYDENGLVVREKQTIFVGEDASGYYSFENSVDEQGNLTAIRRYEDSSEPRDAVFIYGPDGRMLQGYDEYWLTPITYTYVDDPCFCVRDETGSMGDGYGGMTSYTRRVAYILDSAGREVESYVLGTVGEMELTYSEDGYISSVASYYNGYRGVETRFIYGDPADAAAAAAAAPVESVRLTVTGNEVNIRTGPGTEYESRGRVNSGTILVSTGKSGDWYQVEYNGGTGYIIQDYVQQAAAPAPAQPAGGTLAVNGEDVNVRSGPGTGYEALGQVSRGVTLTVTGKSDNWYQVEYKGGTGYIIEDYVILNSAEPAADSAQDTAAMDEAALAATLEGDWSGFIGALAEQYGVMSTEEISMSESLSSPTVWTGGDITGLLSATVLDLDLDGQQELFTVRMDYSSDDWYGDGSYKDHTHLYLTVYEPGSGEPAAERVFFPGAEIVGANLGAMCQFTVFTYDYAGVRYICLDDYATMNETQTIVNFFSYDGSQLVFEGAGDYEEYGEGDVYVYRADTEPDDFRGFTRHLYNNDNHWQTVMSFSVADADWHGLEPGEEQAYFEAYTDILAEYGLIADHDERIWINQTDEDRYKYCTLTAPDVYTAAEGELRPLAQAGRFYEYDSEGNMLFVLHRTDCEGTLDSFR